MNRFVCILALSLLPLSASAQTASTTRHTVGGGDTMYGIVAQYYPERMARWTDVAVDIVELNPDAFPQGLDTVMKLGDELILVDYGIPLVSTRGEPERAEEQAPATEATVDANPPSPSAGSTASYSRPGANLDVVRPDSPVQTVDLSGRRDIAPTAIDNATAATVELREADNAESTSEGQSSDAANLAIGRVVSVSQRALAIDRNNQQRPLAQNDDVFLGDAITTTDNSVITIRMLDDAEFYIQNSSRLMFERYQYDKQNQSGSAIMTLVKGGFGTTSGLLGQHQPDAVTVNTAVATVGIRGTQFALRVCAGNTCRRGNGESLEPGLYTGVLQGAIVVSNNTGDLVTRSGEFFHVAAPNTVPEAAQYAAALLFSADQLAMLDVKIEEEKPLSFLGWLKRKLFDD